MSIRSRFLSRGQLILPVILLGLVLASPYLLRWLDTEGVSWRALLRDAMGEVGWGLITAGMIAVLVFDREEKAEEARLDREWTREDTRMRHRRALEDLDALWRATHAELEAPLRAHIGYLSIACALIMGRRGVWPKSPPNNENSAAGRARLTDAMAGYGTLRKHIDSNLRSLASRVTSASVSKSLDRLSVDTGAVLQVIPSAPGDTHQDWADAIVTVELSVNRLRSAISEEIDAELGAFADSPPTC